MKSLRIIFVDQLSLNNPVLLDIKRDDSLLFYEPCETFNEINHHKQKIVFLISSLRKFIQKYRVRILDPGFLGFVLVFPYFLRFPWQL